MRRVLLFKTLLLLAVLDSTAVVARLLQQNGCGAPVPIKIIHFNDFHAHYTSDTAALATCPAGNETTCFGGMAKVQTGVSTMRAEAQQANQDFLLLHAGDQFTGTQWDYQYTRNNVQIAPEFLNELGIDAYTLGNHEFDYSSQVLASFIGNLTIPVLACNVDFSNEPLLNGTTKRYIIKELPISGLKVGIIGMTDFYTTINSSPSPNIKFLQPADTIESCVADAKNDGAEFIIALTHIGYDSDMELAALPQSQGVDLIVGAHSHSFLYTGEPPPLLETPPTNETAVVQGPYPTYITNNGTSQKQIPIVQAFWAGRYLGNLNLTFASGCGVTAVDPKSNPYLLGDAASSNPVADNTTVTEQLDELYQPIEQLNAQIIGTTTVLLEGERALVRSQETNLGDIVADSDIWYVRNTTELALEYGSIPWVGISYGGAIRSSISIGNISVGDCIAVLPFANPVFVKLINGSILWSALNNGLKQWAPDDSAGGPFPQVSKELRYSFTTASGVPVDGRVIKAIITGPDGTEHDLETYEGDILLATNNFAASGGDNYTMFESAPLILDTSATEDFVLQTYISTVSPISTTVEGRIINCDLNPENADMCGTDSPPPSSDSIWDTVLKLYFVAYTLVLASVV